ncbi:MAG TPA: carboxypeptidase regulatory-like domain-containing protein [Kofleriaceae bacterium]|nr:carboxypeptidase regulatory-like domain-containing protein [Kofleriaceae bacterium]
MKLAAVACAGILLAADRPAEACSCLPPPPPCGVYARAALVFVGEVASTRTTPEFLTAATFTVEEEFKGLGGQKTVVVHGGGMCGATFTAGQKYFVYASDREGRWYAGLCGRTRRLERAQDDLAYARDLPSRSLGEVFGEVRLEDEQEQQAPRAGVTVRVPGTQHAAKTDEAGRYRLWLPPGQHTLDVVDPGTRVRWPSTPAIELTDPSACASQDLVLQYNGRIRGTLLDHAGKPAANVPVSAQGTAARNPLRVMTNAKGEYELLGVQAGEYTVLVNDPKDGGPDARAPFPTTFYPGVPAEAAAKRVKVVRSALVSKIDFKLPKPLPVYTVSGVLRHKGQPKAGIHINMETELRPGFQRGTGDYTDASGRFTLRDIAGAKISLRVCRTDPDPNDYAAACRTVKHTLTGDLTVDLEYPAP